jgi:hypothetical protein
VRHSTEHDEKNPFFLFGVDVLQQALVPGEFAYYFVFIDFFSFGDLGNIIKLSSSIIPVGLISCDPSLGELSGDEFGDALPVSAELANVSPP